MKKTILLFAVMISLNNFSQEVKEEFTGKNELKINAAYTIAGFPEILFERSLTDETSLGISVSFLLDKNGNNNDEENSTYNFSLIPYYRVYFGEKPNIGFFVEGNLALYSQKEREGNFFNNEKTGGTGFGLGFNVGKKYRTKGGWIGEFYFGISRTLINADKVDLIYPRVGITIGKMY